MWSLVGVAGLVLVSCSTIEKQASRAVGTFTGPKGRVALVAQVGFATLDDIMRDADEVIVPTATAGATLKAFVVTTGSGASMNPVTFGASAGQGDFSPEGSNDQAWADEAAAFARAAHADLATAIAASGSSSTGVDLVGALDRGISVVRGAGSDGLRNVVVLTGGGLQRNDAIDLVAVSPADAEDRGHAAAAAMTEPTGVTITIAGAGRFDRMDPPPTTALSDVVTAFWEGVCAGLVERGAASCESAPDLPPDPLHRRGG